MREAVPLAFLYSIEYSDLAPHPPPQPARARGGPCGPVARDRTESFGVLHTQITVLTCHDHTRPDTGAGAPEAELSRLCGLRPYCV